LILVSTCPGVENITELAFKDTSNPDWQYICCNLTANYPQYEVCLDQVPSIGEGKGGDVTIFVNTPAGVEGVCCDYIPLTGASSVPPTNSSYTGMAVGTIYLEADQDEICFCVDHDVPTDPTNPDHTTSVQIHFGKPGQQTESAPLKIFPCELDHFRDCWNFGNDGICLSSVLDGNFYIDVHNVQSDTTPGWTSIIRGQIECVSALAPIE